ncbi:MAG: helix-hairpin-helix domain-containing protein [Candidatus Marinimicrobia bacterium]|nr:helix-hairpin-helix domain-containing protein [Candidatus Neomarinimicrobiota bacterium]MCF7829070.1 helix-hairpin-helix domain-containing protein [Candidatus Neomarinimicrobiota bacterium]MCF7881793.1 helix-hairpin-helix domain-containing protein [Candidatus Neomarinimicrobiota bacterium]
MRRIISIVILLLVALPILGVTPLNVNQATFKEIQELPLTHQQAEALYKYVQLRGPVTSIYQLREVEGIDSKALNELKPLISMSIPDTTETVSRLVNYYNRVENWTSTEGANEGLIELWLERLAEPKNINDATYNDLIALQNVSPVDAVAVLQRLEEGSINYPDALETAIGLSYYGYRNMRDFFHYGDYDPYDQMHLWYNVTYQTFPAARAFGDDVTIQTPTATADAAPGASTIGTHPGELQHKFLATINRHWKAGLAYHRQLGEANRTTTLAGMTVPEMKYAVTYRDLQIGPVTFERIIGGNFMATFGQGVVFESTDYFSPRRSGYGWSKRVPGVFQDLSSSYEYALRGGAFQASAGNLDFYGFASRHPRDAVLNPDGESFSTLITMYPRSDVGYEGPLQQPMKNVVDEVTYGGHARYTFRPGTYIGLSSYESLYDRRLNPDISRSVISAENASRFLTTSGNSADPEIGAMYGNTAESPLWSEAQSLRRVMGVDFSTVIRNIALQGEYGIVDKNGDIGDFSDDPGALVLTGFLQFDNLNFLMVYRDYDLGYDNPYQRSFSNYQRYKGTIFEDTFYLKDPVYGYLYSAQAQPQAERGVYIGSRYQFHRQFVLDTDFDTWTRVADNARYYRTVLSLEYRPVFNYRFDIRQKWQSRGSFNILDPSTFFARETIIRGELRLSNYNNLELRYVNSSVDFTNRRRLTVDWETAGEEPSLVGNAGTGSEALAMQVEHNFTDQLSLVSEVMVYRGFIWNFEDTDFRVFDSPTDALRYWISLFSRVNDNLAFRVKWTVDHRLPITNHNFEPMDSQNVYPDTRLDWETITTRASTSDIRVQLDYAF